MPAGCPGGGVAHNAHGLRCFDQRGKRWEFRNPRAPRHGGELLVACARARRWAAPVEAIAAAPRDPEVSLVTYGFGGARGADASAAAAAGR